MALDRDTTFTWNGHSCFEIRSPGGKALVLDPFLANPNSPKTADQVEACDVMLVTHGHFDHMGDAVAIAARHRPAWPCIHEMSLWLGRRLPGGMDAAIGMNKGGTVEVAGIKVTMVHADHSAGDWNPGGETTLYLGDPIGFILDSRTGSGSMPPATPTCTATCATSASSTRRSWRCCRSAGTTRWGRAAPRSRPSCSACSTSSRSTTGRSRSWRARRISSVPSWPRAGCRTFRSTPRNQEGPSTD